MNPSNSEVFGFADELLYLFSSNLRPLYAQDILDLLALPPGARFQFRYLRSWIEQNKTIPSWGQLVGKKILVNFSLQQAANYHNPAFIPVRLGTVTRTNIIGNIFSVEFELTDYVCLKKQQTEGKPREIYGPSVQNYNNELEHHHIPRPYQNWVGLGPGLWDVLEVAKLPDTQTILFERITEFLSHTESFRRARYFRILSLQEAETEQAALMSSGKFNLRCGHSYQLELIHTQPAEIETSEEFLITADEGILRVIGRKSFEVSSRYNYLKIHLYVVQQSTNESRETVLAIDPFPGVQGPRVRLTMVANPDIKRTTTAILGSAVGALLLGVPSLIPSLAQGVKVAFVLFASALMGWLSIFGLKRT